MKNVTVAVLLQAIAEMEQRYQETDLRRHLLRFRTILHRSKTLSNSDKQIVETKMQSYDSLLDGDPVIQEEIRQEIEQQVEQQVKQQVAEHELEVRRQTALIVLEARFPDLVDIAQSKIGLVNKSEVLSFLTVQIAKAPDEKIARWVLDTLVA